jgi:hypothetical protein
MTEIPQERVSSCYYFERYEYKIMGDMKVLHGPLAVENGWQWAIGIEEGAKEKYKEPTIARVSRVSLEVRYCDENAVCLDDRNLRNADYRSTEASERCGKVLEYDGWTFL